MKKQNTILTIFRKECARFFGDRALVFTSIIMPGLMLYLIYTLMGNGMRQDVEEEMSKAGAEVAMYVENLPAAIVPLIDSCPLLIESGVYDSTVFQKVRDKENAAIYVVFPEGLDSYMAEAPGHYPDSAFQIRIYYNSENPASQQAYYTISSAVEGWELSRLPNIVDINGDADEVLDLVDEAFDLVDEASAQEDFMDNLLSELIPILILMMLFSATMSVAPTAIAGEKERGTIATLLVTPMRRSELAWGKILSLSLFALLSGCSSFLGIMLSLPKMIGGDELDMSVSYAVTDYVVLLAVILSTVLVMISAVSLLSALAKDTKQAGTLTVPFMLAILAIGMSPLLGGGEPPSGVVSYLLPFYNSVQVMSSVFARKAVLTHVVATVGSNVVYTGIAVWTLAKMFNSEKIMFKK